MISTIIQVKSPNDAMQPTTGRRTPKIFRDSNRTSRHYTRPRQRWLILFSLGGFATLYA